MFFPIGDIHGEYDLLKGLYDKILEEIDNGFGDGFPNTIVFLGDYIDRGPQSKQVLDFLMRLQNTDDLKHIFLVGNHEDFIIEYRKNPNNLHLLKSWLHYGGKETLDSFDASVQDLVSGKLDRYIEWMDNLPFLFETTDYVFVHGNIHKDFPITAQSRDYSIWPQNPYPQLYRDYYKVVVHGHLMPNNPPYPLIDIKNNRIWMDVGACWYNRLCAACLPEVLDRKEEIKVIEFKNP